MSLIRNTDTMTDHLTGEKQKPKTIFQKCGECFCPSMINCIYNIIFVCMCLATTYYLIFGILCIYNNIYKLHNPISLCTISHLTYYIIISMVYACLRFIYPCIIKNKKITITMCYIGICIVLELLLLSWGLTEVYMIPNILNINPYESNIIEFNITEFNKTACHDIKYTPLWKFGLITVISQVTIISLLIVTICYICYKY